MINLQNTPSAGKLTAADFGPRNEREVALSYHPAPAEAATDVGADQAPRLGPLRRGRPMPGSSGGNFMIGLLVVVFFVCLAAWVLATYWLPGVRS